MNSKTLASVLNGIEYPCEISRDIAKQAHDAGLVIVYGLSDDLMELSGSIRDEIGANNGVTVYVDHEGLLPARDNIDDDDELQRYFAREPNAMAIKQLWCAEDGYSWTYKTEIPHETFDIMEDGEPYCRGIVFALADVVRKKV